MEGTTITDSKTYNLFVTLLEGKTLTLKFNTPNVAADSIKRRLLEVTKIPLRHQRLVTGTRQLADDSVISCSSSAADAPCFPTVSLLLRLVGGKGGFGSLLRGAATKAGQKKTSNFDACRDMSGRRLRHVNAEKKLEEWRAEAEERRLEKAAEEFLNNLAKKGKKGSGDAAAEKYVARYKQESERCVEEVLNSVKEGLKRKGSAKEAVSGSKKLKFWMGKSKGESDSEDDDSDNEDKKEKSIVLNSAGSSDSSKEEGSLDSVSDRKHDAEGGSEEEREIVVQATLDFGGSPGEESLQTEKIVGSASVSCSEPDVVLGPEPLQDEKMVCSEPEMDNLEEVVSRSPDGSSSGDGEGVESIPIVSEANALSESNPGVLDEKAASGKTLEPEKPLNFDEFNSAAEMEVLGLERLKTELQARGLKCGGTLQERASRLFMLKSTPIEKIPKKLLAKK